MYCLINGFLGQFPIEFRLVGMVPGKHGIDLAQRPLRIVFDDLRRGQALLVLVIQRRSGQNSVNSRRLSLSRSKVPVLGSSLISHRWSVKAPIIASNSWPSARPISGSASGVREKVQTLDLPL